VLRALLDFCGDAIEALDTAYEVIQVFVRARTSHRGSTLTQHVTHQRPCAYIAGARTSKRQPSTDAPAVDGPRPTRTRRSQRFAGARNVLELSSQLERIPA
jgi:hypothetical protein